MVLPLLLWSRVTVLLPPRVVASLPERLDVVPRLTCELPVLLGVLVLRSLRLTVPRLPLVLLVLPLL